MVRGVSSFFICAAAFFLSSCGVTRIFSKDHSEYLTVSRIDSTYSPQGKITEVFHKCTVQGPSSRRMLVYLPPEYDGVRRFPVMYVIHGARGNETSWITEGDLFQLADSLRSNGLAEPSIYVLPNMNQYDDDEDYGNSRFKRPLESFFETDGAVETGFMNDVVHTVDSLFTTIPDKKHRALAGLSVGGFQATYISARNPDAFDYVGLFSSFCRGPIRKSDYSDYFKGLGNLHKVQFADPPKVYLLGSGFYDVFLFHNDMYRIYMKMKGYPYQYIETAGGHSWSEWKQYFVEFVKMCFKS